MVIFHVFIKIIHELLMLDRYHLRIVRELERQGSLTAAAAELHLTQSALSHAIKKLEQFLGAPVWAKEGRNLRLTPAGEYLAGLARRLLPQFEHAETVMRQIASGQRGTLRIGMECHPCYQWLLKVVSPYLAKWPDVDVDVKQEFQFGGIGALFAHEIDVLVTPDPLQHKGLVFTPVFDYEQVLVVAATHPLAKKQVATPTDLATETLITYPVAIERLDIFSQFLLPAHCLPRQHKTIETTDIMLQMVAAGRGVAALPGWLAREYQLKMPLATLRLGQAGIAKQIHLGLRELDASTDYLSDFIRMAESVASI
ncbi:MAG TPA: LysR substrate-binding domain-containing protein [Cellvibrionaceae bacterium]